MVFPPLFAGPIFGNAPWGKSPRLRQGGGGWPALQALRAPDATNGNCLVAEAMNWWAIGRISKTPKLPRTAVLPLRNGSQANPTRGSKLRRVEFPNRGPPGVQFGSGLPQREIG